MKSNEDNVYNGVYPVYVDPIRPSAFTRNFQSNEQPICTNNNTSIFFNDRQSNNPFSPNIESTFSPTANPLDFYLINELINWHNRSLRKEMMYFYIAFGILLLIGLILLFTGILHLTCSTYSYDCSSVYLVYLILGVILVSIGIMFALTCLCADCYTKQQVEDVNFSINGQQPVVWRLDGEQWVRYLNYIHGPNRIWKEIGPLLSFSSRRSTYERLMNRLYGQIILHENGLIIDELHFVSFRQFTLQRVEILYIDQHPRIIGLRIHTHQQTGKTWSNCYFDLFAPSSVSLEQIQALARAYIIKKSGVSALDLRLEEIHLPGSILSTHS
ncbi:unnamed protein product [Adineta steineri]|uniref:Uncharacterized protein n=1 Tax=Adineta steineri TaxID=433720 RepID=A0A816EF75_9BILA|nr:unnamed protein product [Adineta steineri]CAF1648961.1 unnamed protein product [Adineta steineri]